MTEEKITAFQCESVGISGTTQVFVRRMAADRGSAFVARVGIAIMGQTNMAPELLKDANPFDESFRDNYCEGVGGTQEEAIAALKRDIEETSQSLWW